MRPLPEIYSKKGFDNRQIIRGEKAAIYARWRNEALVAYEVFEIKPGSAFEMGGVKFEAAEMLPHDNAFGIWAWSFVASMDYLIGLRRALEKFNHIHNMETLNVQDPQVIEDAVRMLKSEFVELYTKLGYDKTHTGVSWHTIRTSPKGQEMRKSIYQGAQHLQATTFITDMEQEVKERAKKKKPSLTAPDQGSENAPEGKVPKTKSSNDKASGKVKGDKAKQAKALIEAGETDPEVLVEKVGLSKIYAKTLLKKFGK